MKVPPTLAYEMVDAVRATINNIRNAGTTIGGTNQLLAVSLSGRPGALAVAGESGVLGKLVMLCRPITTCQREAKAIPLISGTDRAEISGSDCADCDGTRFAGSPFWRMPQPVLRSAAYPSEGPSIRE